MQTQYTIQHKIAAIRASLPTKEALAQSLLATFGVLLFLYLYFVIAITFNIVDRKAMAASIKDETSQVSLLEASYTNEVGKIDQNVALAMGFTEPVKTQFAMKKSDIVVGFAR